MKAIAISTIIMIFSVQLILSISLSEHGLMMVGWKPCLALRCGKVFGNLIFDHACASCLFFTSESCSMIHGFFIHVMNV